MINPMYCSQAAYMGNLTITQKNNTQVIWEIVIIVVVAIGIIGAFLLWMMC